MRLYILVIFVLLGATVGEEKLPGRGVESPRVIWKDNGLGNTELVLAFVIFRHGDRTPDDEEIAFYPDKKILEEGDYLFFPYGKKALTNKGKQRGYFVGKYLRELYDGFISKLYLPDEITIRTTDFARTKMTALAALSALYPPPPAQKWNPNLDWQPIPYNTLPYDQDDLLYWTYDHCPRYAWLRDQIFERPEVKKWIGPNQGLFKELSDRTGTNITNPEHVYFLDNLFQTLNNVGVKTPQWAQKLMPNIKDLTKIEFAAEVYTTNLIKLATGVLMQSIIHATNAAIHSTNVPKPKLYLYSAHENNVAALMAAARVFEPHQPNYGATFSLELRRNKMTREYGFAAIYAPNAGGPGEILPIKGCGDQLLCEYNTFLSLVKDVLCSREEMEKQCKNHLQL